MASSVFLLRTYFDPDEYWQCVEPACKLAFGHGALTWEWQKGMRGWLYPVVFGGTMWLVKRVFRIGDEHDYLIVELVPKFIQALVTALIDFYTYKLAMKYQPKLGKRVLILMLGSWFMFCYVNRTLTNSLECALTVMAMFYDDKKALKYTLIALATVARPTAILNWIFMDGFYSVDAVAPFLICHFWSSLLDSLLYGELTFVPWNFVYENLISGKSGHFGVSGVFYYLTAALPCILLSYAVYFIRGLRLAPNYAVRHVLSLVLIYSCLSHKEIRFLMSSVPSVMIICANGMAGTSRRLFKTAIVLQLACALYFSFSFQAGPVACVKWLRTQPYHEVFFLTPCHSVPWTGFLARFNSEEEVTFKQLECDPTKLDAEGLDESDHFYLDPEGYLDKHILANIVVSFEPLSELLTSRGYTEIARFHNGHWNPDPRRSGDMIVWRKGSL